MDNLPDCSISNIKSVDQIVQILGAYEQILQKRTYHHLGYPYNLEFDYNHLNNLVNFSINNLGDPFIPSNYGVHSRPFEVAVLSWFAQLWGLPEDDYWGYVTACGTEGNLHGIWLGRENMDGDGSSVVLMGSRASHYSVWKAARMYCMEICQLATLPSDELDYDDLYTRLKELKDGGKRVVMVVNIGSTVRGAVDDVGRITAAFDAAGFLPQQDYFLHLDGALFGMMLPFIAASDEANATQLTFKDPSICSISVSGHKFIGSPVPCGIVMTRRKHIDKLSQDIAYINSRDATILGSRNGHASLFLWYAIVKKGLVGFRRETQQCMQNAIYMADKLRAARVPNVMLNTLSSTVVFARPKDPEFVQKWQLACEGEIAHVIVMPNVDRAKIDDFIADLIICQ